MPPRSYNSDLPSFKSDSACQNWMLILRAAQCRLLSLQHDYCMTCLCLNRSLQWPIWQLTTDINGKCPPLQSGLESYVMFQVNRTFWVCLQDLRECALGRDPCKAGILLGSWTIKNLVTSYPNWSKEIPTPLVRSSFLNGTSALTAGVMQHSAESRTYIVTDASWCIY